MMEKEVADLLPPWIYYTATILLFGFNVAGAIWIEEVEHISGIIGGLSCAMINFLLPGLFYWKVSKMRNSLNPKRWKIILAWVFSIYGLVFGVMSVVLRIVSIIQDS